MKTRSQTRKENMRNGKFSDCPCGGGYTCIVFRRKMEDHMAEDKIFNQIGLPLRKNCFTILSQEQENALEKYSADESKGYDGEKEEGSMPPICNYDCPCGGGQSCIVSRRSVNDWVFEDKIFTQFNLPIRENCFTILSQEQEKLMNEYTN